MHAGSGRGTSGGSSGLSGGSAVSLPDLGLGRPGRTVVVTLALGVVLAGVVLLATVVALVRRAARTDPMTPYVAPQYWLGHDDGFVRRGLPGAALRALFGGRPPTLALANAAAVGLTVAALLALLVLAVVLARRAGDRWATAALAAAVVATPLGLSHTARDLGRPDALGVLVAVVLVTVPWARLPPVLAVVLVALLTSAAIGAVELLAVLVLPLAWWALRTAFPSWRARALAPTLAVPPLRWASRTALRSIATEFSNRTRSTSSLLRKCL